MAVERPNSHDTAAGESGEWPQVKQYLDRTQRQQEEQLLERYEQLVEEIKQCREQYMRMIDNLEAEIREEQHTKQMAGMGRPEKRNAAQERLDTLYSEKREVELEFRREYRQLKRDLRDVIDELEELTASSEIVDEILEQS